MTAEFLKVRSPEDIDFPTCSKHTAFSAGDVYATERTSLQTDSTHSISTKALHFLSFPSFPVGFFWNLWNRMGLNHDLGRGHAVRLRAAPADEDVLLASLGAMAAGKPRKLGPCMSQQGAVPMLARKGTKI